MRVLIISNMYPRFQGDDFGVFVHEQALELKRQGMDVKVISPVPYTTFLLSRVCQKYRNYYDQELYKEIDGITVFYPRYVAFPRNIKFDQIGQKMTKGIERVVGELSREWKFDLIHAHAALPNGYAGMFFKKKYNVPLFVTIHGADFQSKINLNDKVKESVRQALEGSNQIILVSTKLYRIQQREFPSISEECTHVIANGIDKSFLEQKAHQEDKKEIVILSVSHLIEQKGVQFNLKAVAQLVDKYPNLKYQIVGDGSFRPEVERLINSLGITEHVELIGKVPRPFIKSYMDGCDIFSLPSWNEAFGIVYTEAMACGKPVIGCAGEGIEDFVTDRENGFLVKARNVEALIEILDQLIQDEGLRMETGKRARQVIDRQYTWEKNVKQLTDLYEKELNES